MNEFRIKYRTFISDLLGTHPIHTGEWQSTDVSKSLVHATYELIGAQLDFRVPEAIADLQTQVEPNLPWAENHFRERVGGKPLNPGDEYKNWPWYKGNVQDHQTIDNNQFSHTYMERFWPKIANGGQQHGGPRNGHVPMLGIRFPYGDLQNVVDLLIKSPLTRQAYLPVWFPEDTGAVHGERVPCTLGYHFLIRNNRLHCWYSMRSCDILRHFKDDVYLAGRLMQWVCKQYNGREFTNAEISSLAENEAPEILKPGTLHMTMSSLHAFVGDRWRLEQIINPPDDVESS